MQSIINLKGAPEPQMSKKRRFLSPIILIPLIIVIIFIVMIDLYLLQKPTTVTISQLDSEKYWAVFLTNEQVYFGHLKNLESDYPQLTDVYYFILRKPLQGQLEEETAKVEPSLIKMGNEIHGPLDSMIINKDHILFVEQLKDDSKVVKAIKEYKKGMQY